MQTVANVPYEEELDLLRLNRPEPAFRQWRTAATGSLALHILLIAFLAFAPTNVFTPVAVRPPRARPLIVTHLVDPPTELTQKAPNRQKLSKELTAEAILPRPVVRNPSPAPVTRRMMSPPPAPAPAASQPVAPKIVAMEPPKPDIVAANRTQPNLPQASAVQATAPPPVEKPKLVFETPQSATGPVSKTPNPALAGGNPVQEAMRNIARSGSSGAQQVGDANVDLSSIGPGLNLPPSAGRPRSSLELKSDPQGVDFKPYLIRVLATVRRNWFAIYPEAARLGQRGQVMVEFAVAKDGSIAKVAYSSQSGSRALDEAAVAALSASNPLPPLPAEFRGVRVVLQFTFSYNIVTR